MRFPAPDPWPPREPLAPRFFDRDPLLVAPELLGRLLFSRVEGGVSGGVIVETEAYLGAADPGSHAATKGMTRRNAVMFGAPGTAYVYFTYGFHHMFNVVCGPHGQAGAVLIRAISPTAGVEEMRSRRSGRSGPSLTNGPGKLTAALGIDLRDNGSILPSGRIALCDAPMVDGSAIGTSGRVGVSAGAELPFRYYVRDNAYVSGGPRLRG